MWNERPLTSPGFANLPPPPLICNSAAPALKLPADTVGKAGLGMLVFVACFGVLDFGGPLL